LADVAAHPGSSWLIAGAWLSILAALAHLACIVGGPEWYRFFGAGEAMARAAGRGEWTPTLVTLGIAAMLLVWGAYALSGAGLLPRLPLLRTGLAVIAAIYLLRALAFVPLNLVTRHHSDGFAIISSLIVLIYGVVHAIGTAKAWEHLAR
jgi:hypothetical protein